MNRSVNIISTWIGVLIALVFMAVIMAWPTQLLWNHCLVPALDSVNPIGFWQALGINFLTTVLFKNNSVKFNDSKTK
jgi:hypothetical protein